MRGIWWLADRITWRLTEVLVFTLTGSWGRRRRRRRGRKRAEEYEREEMGKESKCVKRQGSNGAGGGLHTSCGDYNGNSEFSQI